MFWPMDLAVIYPYVTTPPWQFIMMATLLVIITVIVCKYFLKYPYLAVGWFWYAGTLVPVIGIVQVGNQSMADRYAYIPFIGLFVMLVWGMGHVLKKIFPTKVVAIISGMILVALIIVSHYQVQYWQNTFTLFKHAVNVTENNPIAQSNLAGELLIQNKAKEAMQHCQIALSLTSLDYNTLVRVARAYSVMGDRKRAIDALRLAIKVHPEYARAYNDLYILLLQVGKAGEGIEEYQKGVMLNINMDNVELHSNFGNALALQHYYDEAVTEYNQVLRIQAWNAFAHNNLAMVLLWQGKIDDALDHFREAVKLQPKYANAHYQLALILKQKGLTEEANRHYQDAVRINPVFKDRK
jgi:tetratricopeptide (TPR) repeat protein